MYMYRQTHTGNILHIFRCDVAYYIRVSRTSYLLHYLIRSVGRSLLAAHTLSPLKQRASAPAAVLIGLMSAAIWSI
jgi:hypothetical protein